MNIKWNKIKEINQYNEELLELRKCPVCEEALYKKVIEIEKFQFFSDSDLCKQVDIVDVQCKNCSAIYMNPCYSKIGFSILFEEAGMSYGSSEGRPNEQVEWIKERGILKQGISILDIGCGSGNFLKALPNNINRIGIDIDKTSIDIAQQKNEDIKFICSDFEELNYNEEIDLITMYHVLEHLPNPKKVLNRLYELSKDSTNLLIEVPIIENGLTNDINGFFSVQHLTHFSRNSFKNILQSTGWEILEWQEQKEYNGCRVLAKKGNKKEILLSDKELVNNYIYLSNWYNSIGNVENKIIDLTNDKYIIYGAGMHLEFLYQTTSLFKSKKEFIIVDSDKNKHNKTWRGINIYPPEILRTLTNETIIISSYGSQDKIEKFIRENNQTVTVVKLYEYLKVY